MVGAVQAGATDLRRPLPRQREGAAGESTPEQENYLRIRWRNSGTPRIGPLRLAQGPNQAEARTQIQILAAGPAGSVKHGRVPVAGAEQRERGASCAANCADFTTACSGSVSVLTATLIAILFTSLNMIRSIGDCSRNSRRFPRSAGTAQKLIATQESTLRHISRELHDEFGQILTAGRDDADACGKSAPEGRSCAPNCAKFVRLRKARWTKCAACRRRCIRYARRDRTGEHARLVFAGGGKAGWRSRFYEKSGDSFPVDGNAAIHGIAWSRKL